MREPRSTVGSQLAEYGLRETALAALAASLPSSGASAFAVAARAAS